MVSLFFTLRNEVLCVCVRVCDLNKQSGKCLPSVAIEGSKQFEEPRAKISTCTHSHTNTKRKIAGSMFLWYHTLFGIQL